MGFLSVLALSVVHLFANQAKVLGWLWHGRFLSFAAGISFAYVFVDLLPALEKGQPLLKQTFDPFVPYFDKHAYLLALLGLLFYYGLQRQSSQGKTANFWLSLSGYLVFNFLIGASLSDTHNPDIQPLALFTIAIATQDFVEDHKARQRNEALFHDKGRWWLVAALIVGYAVGYITKIPDAVVALAISFLAGGILLNVLHYELPNKKRSGYFPFLIGALLYTALLVGIGEV